MIGRLRRGPQVLVRCDPATGTPLRDARGRCTKVEKPGETGLLLGRISSLNRFDGYVDERETDKKIVRNVLSEGDAYFNSGDLLTLHEDSWVSFADRVGDTFRHKGENVSTMEIAEILHGAPGVLESNVYGVVVPGSDGRAGMASLRVDSSFDLGAFGAYVAEKLPGYARPYFIRLLEDMQVTATLKHQKVDYRAEGFDPAVVRDPLYFLDGTRYIALDDALFRRLMAGEMKLGARGA
jgi:acyl-CoA synthetase (AMP-forming)/AMP-acid ligase II